MELMKNFGTKTQIEKISNYNSDDFIDYKPN